MVIVIFFASFLCSFILISNLRLIFPTYAASQSLQSTRYTTFVLSHVLHVSFSNLYYKLSVQNLLKKLFIIGHNSSTNGSTIRGLLFTLDFYELLFKNFNLFSMCTLTRSTGESLSKS